MEIIICIKVYFSINNIFQKFNVSTGKTKQFLSTDIVIKS